MRVAIPLLKRGMPRPARGAMLLGVSLLALWSAEPPGPGGRRAAS